MPIGPIPGTILLHRQVPPMFFLWPQYLWLLLALPVLPAVYVWLLRRRGKPAVRYSSLGVVRAAAAPRHWRRHVPPALLLLACSGLLFAAARPVAQVPLPWARASIMLAMDVSLSMRVTDVKPSRMEAAQEAAKLFLRELPKNIEVGLVTFAGSSQVAQRATLDRESLVTAIDAFQMQMHTAVGNAIVLCLAELFPDHGIDVGEITFGSSSARGAASTTRPSRRPTDHARRAGLVQLRRDHPADRRSSHHRHRHARSGEDGRRSRRTHLRGGAGHARATPPRPRACPSTCSWTSLPCAKWRA